MEYWINIDGVDNGPYTKDEMITLRAEGSISDANMACSTGDSSWSTVGQLFPLPSSSQELPPAPSPPTKSAKQRIEDIRNKQKATIESMGKAEKATDEQIQESKDEDPSIKHDFSWWWIFLDRIWPNKKSNVERTVMETAPPRVVIQGIDIPILDMVSLMLKWFVASLIVSAVIAVIVVFPIWIVMENLKL